MSARAIVVLGCKLGVGAREGHLAGPSKRRVDAAAHAWNARASDVSLVVVTGGRMWNGVVEADALASALAEQGLPQEAILRERCSFHTGDNARFTAALLSQRTIDEIFLVTCDWHLPRARRAFERRGLRVHDVPAVTPPRSLRQRVWRWCAERVAERFTAWSVLAVVACLALLGVGCRKSESENASQVDASAAHNAAQGEPAEWGAIARAEDLRRAADVTEAMIAHPDTRVRRRAARALARIADDASVAGLMHALADPDETVAAWGAY
ncbi:MAG TPA: YdcF family protein, partial [Polyangiaceae bacterium]|nr:YdcF family protein [Polyangiaceae bacterium]